MLVWIIDPYDAIPGEKWGYKHGIFLSQALIEHGHTVHFWTTSFSHSLKEQRADRSCSFSASERLHIHLVRCRSYTGHIGLRRVWSLLQFAFGVLAARNTMHPPDCIILSVPCLLGDLVALYLARRFRAKLISDFRDLWPEVFALSLPRRMRFISPLLFYPIRAVRALVLRHSDGIAAVCKTYLEVAKEDVGPSFDSSRAIVVYHTNIESSSRTEMFGASEASADTGARNPARLVAIYAGTIGEGYDVRTLVSAAKLALNDFPELQIVVAGDGPARVWLQQEIVNSSLTNIKYVGALTKADLFVEYARASVSLCLYASGSTVAMPAKAYDYIAAELPIINSLAGEFSEFISEHHVGFDYVAGDPLSLLSALKLAASSSALLQGMRWRLKQLAPQFYREVQYGRYVEFIEKVNMQ